jgi:small conductance mechanosensitive channel
VIFAHRLLGPVGQAGAQAFAPEVPGAFAEIDAACSRYMSSRIKCGSSFLFYWPTFCGGIVNIETIRTFIMTQGVDFGIRILGAIVLWIIGRWLIGLVSGVLRKLLTRNSRIDPTLARYMGSVLGALLNLVLILAILQVFGVQTTSFAALLAGLGLAIGTAWGGLLAHFAAGVFMQVLRPFKVGDFVSAGGVTGTVHELGLFGTTIITPDNVMTTVGNNTVFSGTISNFSALPVRRVELTAKVANGVDVHDAMTRLRAAIAKIPNVTETPAPDVEVLSFTPEGPLLCVRPYTHNASYWQVYFDTNRAIIDTFREAGYPTPETPLARRQV